jgi:organic hydroperoxide reductase OsmC/OhrA
MSQHTAVVEWHRGEVPFTHDRYSRVHAWSFDGGIEIRASASPSVVPVPLSDPAAVDPEEAFVAALSSCHMLWFLALAAKARVTVDAYRDAPIGTMMRMEDGRQVLGRIVLRPKVTLAEPTEEETLRRLHADAHHQCFLANALKVDLEIAPEPVAIRKT